MMQQTPLVNHVSERFGEYELISFLGRGGFADVFLGKNVALSQQLVAVKVLHKTMIGEKSRQFKQEAATIHSLSHAHIIHFITFGIRENTQNTLTPYPYIIMEYVPKGSLRQKHPRGSRLPFATIVSYMQQIVDALQFAHGNQIMHLDVKPENILINASDQLLLSDFGLATLVTDEEKKTDIQGTLSYMAPEQIRGRPDRASDQYSLGIMVYEWLCGSVPFVGQTIEEVMHKQQNEAPPSLRTQNAAISPQMEAVVLKALSKEVKDRFISVIDFAKDFEKAVNESANGVQAPAPQAGHPVVVSDIHFTQPTVAGLNAKPQPSPAQPTPSTAQTGTKMAKSQLKKNPPPPSPQKIPTPPQNSPIPPTILTPQSGASSQIPSSSPEAADSYQGSVQQGSTFFQTPPPAGPSIQPMPFPSGTGTNQGGPQQGSTFFQTPPPAGPSIQPTASLSGMGNQGGIQQGSIFFQAPPGSSPNQPLASPPFSGAGTHVGTTQPTSPYSQTLPASGMSNGPHVGPIPPLVLPSPPITSIDATSSLTIQDFRLGNLPAYTAPPMDQMNSSNRRNPYTSFSPAGFLNRGFRYLVRPRIRRRGELPLFLISGIVANIIGAILIGVWFARSYTSLNNENGWWSFIFWILYSTILLVLFDISENKYLRFILSIALAIFWGFVGNALAFIAGTVIGFLPDANVLSFLFFLISLGIHLSLTFKQRQ